MTERSNSAEEFADIRDFHEPMSHERAAGAQLSPRIEITRIGSNRDFWGSVEGIRRLASQTRIGADMVYGAAIPRLRSNVGSQQALSRGASLEEGGERDLTSGKSTPEKPASPKVTPSRALGHEHEVSSLKTLLLRSLGCLGVIWGDIGTSPLYAYSAVYGCHDTCISPTPEDIKGTLSTIVWALIWIVFIKYILTVMRCDFHGEGGLFAVLRLIRSESARPLSDNAVSFFTAVGAMGSAAMVADGLITPALSVLSAMGGLEDDRIWGPEAAKWSEVLTVIILLLLFCWQFKGTTKVGRVFGPIMIIYFIGIGGIGLYNIVKTGNTWVLEGWSPHYFVKLWLSGQFSGYTAFKTMGSVVLAVTGAEATYADLGHFGKGPVYVSWMAVVLPALILSYTGQAAYMASHPEAVGEIFFASVPGAIYIPMWILSTLATIIASQAMITGCYSIVSQGIALGLLPRMKTVNTDPRQKAQIYIPAATVLMCIGTIALVLGFKSAEALSSAYGISVVLTFLMTDVMVAGALYTVKLPKAPLVFVMLLMLPFFLVDGLFFASTLSGKVGNGGYLPVAIGFVVTLVMLSWRFGRRATNKAYERMRQVDISYLYSIEKLVNAVKEGNVAATPGTGVFLCPTWVEPLSGDALPSTLGLFLRVTGAIPSRCILLTVAFEKTAPFIAENDRRKIVEIVKGFYSVSLTYGFAEPLSEISLTKAVEELLPSLALRDTPQQSSTSQESNGVWYYLHSEDIEPRKSRKIWTKAIVALYSIILRFSSRASTFFGIPAEKVVQLGDILLI